MLKIIVDISFKIVYDANIMKENTKVCSLCKLEKSLVEFYSNGYQPSGNKKYKSRCKPCEEKYRLQLFLKKIIKILEIKGKKYQCESCGYNKNLAALTFHHIDPKKKEFSLSSAKTMSQDKLIKELDKCIVLCANCHMEEHYPHLTNIIVDSDCNN